MTTSFVRLAVNVPSMAGVFDYAVPKELTGVVRAGQLVLAPFGSQRVYGVVVECIDQASVSETKEIVSIVDPEPVLSEAQLRFAQVLARSTLSSMAAIIALFLPPGLARQADTLYSLSESPPSTGDLGEAQKRMVNLLQERGPLRGRQINRALAGVKWRQAAASLVRRQMLSSQSVLPPVRVRPKVILTAQLAVSPEEAQQAMQVLSKRPAPQARRAKALRYLLGRPEPVNVAWVYAESGCGPADLDELAERQLITLHETEIWRDPVDRIEKATRPGREIDFTAEQQAAWQAIDRALNEAANGVKVKPVLLQGVTGSGKTELYIRAACAAVELGRQALILVPEIALTAQTVQRFVQRFPGQTGLVHSRLSDGERYDTWRRARLGLLKVVIGARSALFAPLPSVGLIVLDECHDASYYQSEPPFYNATTAAQAYAEVSGGLCILGSATPSVVQQYQAEIGRSNRLRLVQRVGPNAKGGEAQALELPAVKVVDMRDELKAGNRGILSRDLHEALGHTLQLKQQAILFMNRRGSATYVFCRTCGTAMKCPRCETPLTYHASAGENLLCHRCRHSERMPHRCPQCGNPSVRAYGLGTEKVEAEVQRLFPAARTLRWDWETTREKDAHEMILAHFAAGRADILIGTQMLAKGLDLPRVTLVGMILADVGLHLPDPFAAERTFQVLTQVAGRAGRRPMGGRTILQTFEPEHYAIRAAAGHDVDGFYVEEAAQRRRLGYPPFAGLMRLEVRDEEPQQAERKANVLATALLRNIRAGGRSAVSMVGPAPCFTTRVDGRYRWHIVLRGANLRELLPERLGPDWWIEVEPASLL